MEEQIVIYSRGNIAKVDIFLKDPYVKRFIREEKISEITFVGTVGGLLGLFLGFSFISAVEIVYLCVLACFSSRKPEKKEHSAQDFPKYVQPYFNTKIYDTKYPKISANTKVYPTRWHEWIYKNYSAIAHI